MRFMQMAISLGLRNLGHTGANPSVGCIIVKNNHIIGRGVTAPGGRPHAETIALAMAGKEAKGATVYITLEPCAHHGQTPPCTEALIKAGVTKVIIALRDPDPRVNGNGEAQLKNAGIIVECWFLSEQAKELHAGFISRITLNRPTITLKLATSLDGRIALANGKSRWITNERSRAYAHRLRANHDAIIVGSNTVILDNPQLTCRLPGLEDRSPVRIILDGKGKIPSDSKVFSGSTPTWLFTTKTTKITQPTDNTQIFYTDATKDGMLPLRDVCRTLSEKGINRLLVEGGSLLAASFLNEQLVDEIHWLQSPKIIGGDGLPAIANLSIQTLEDNHVFRTRSTANLEGDRLLILKKA
jgi:diaminohydroxyphosphoribosylaminopyrimidine deaminase/5-amino-6-(5-phosphoribosylamino)uracil reductase